MNMRRADEKLCHLKVCMLCLVLCFLFLQMIIGHLGRVSVTEAASRRISIEGVIFSKDIVNRTNSGLLKRKLLLAIADYGGDQSEGSCSKDSIVIFQGPTSPLPSGIPTYTVQIQNVCITGCSIYNIHVSCGWFSSARLINPSVFRRLAYDDCLVNDGEPLGPGESLSFQYANSFRYPLSVSAVAC